MTLRAIPNPSWASFPTGQPIWSGAASATGATATATFSSASSSDSDLKQVTVSMCGNENRYFLWLVCGTIVGHHADGGWSSDNGGSSLGHAWITVHDLIATNNNAYGAYQTGHPATSGQTAAVSGCDVWVNLDPLTGQANRYFLLSPSQQASLATYLNTCFNWGYFNNCTAFELGAAPHDISGSIFPATIKSRILSSESTDPSSLSSPVYQIPRSW